MIQVIETEGMKDIPERGMMMIISPKIKGLMLVIIAVDMLLEMSQTVESTTTLIPGKEEVKHETLGSGGQKMMILLVMVNMVDNIYL